MSNVMEVDAFGNGGWLFRFDGSVLQIFGMLTVHTGSHAMNVDAWSIHARQATVRLFGPKKDRTWDIAFCSAWSEAACPERGILKLTELNETMMAGMQPLVAALGSAGTQIIHVP